MVKVITYGTYDLLHYGHIRLLERAKALGDYLIVGVTSDDFDKSRGKINVQQSLMERIEAVRSLNIADEIIVEEYEGQKIDDIKRYGIDIFTVGSDWVGKFDYLSDYCKVVYLDRTEGISSSEIREKSRQISLGLVGESNYLNKVAKECVYVNGIHITGICTQNKDVLSDALLELPCITDNYDELLKVVDAVYIRSHPRYHYEQIKKALLLGKAVLCESPVALNKKDSEELFELAKQHNVILMEGLKTAYSTAYSRLQLLAKDGRIGNVISIDATCTSLRDVEDNDNQWSSMYEWGPTTLLPIFQILGTDYEELKMVTKLAKDDFDLFTKLDLRYKDTVASAKIGIGAKAEGDLVISGTNGYIYVPAPWWITDYFEVRYEDATKNKRYFYQLDGEGIRYELVAFLRSIQTGNKAMGIDEKISNEIAEVMNQFLDKKYQKIG